MSLLKTSTDCLKYLSFSLALLLAGQSAYSQDSTKVDQKKIKQLDSHSPGKAAMYSAVFPGLGQIYNGKHQKKWMWKLPIIYGGFGTLAYFIIYNDQNYHKARNHFSNWTGNPVTIDGITVTTDAQMRELKDYYRRNRDFSYVLTAGLYLLQIIDANVDAHLIDFEVDEKLLLSLEPHLESTPTAGTFGLSMKLRF